ncbi:MAG: cytochrome b562 [Opitutales bacterium]
MKTSTKRTSLAALCMLILTSALPLTSHAGGNLHDLMEEMQDAYRVAGRAIRSPEENLAKLLDAAQTMQEGAVLSKKVEVELPDGAPIADADAYQVKYKIAMTKTLLALVQFEQALLMKDFDAAKTAWAAVKASKGEGHDEFKIDE